MLFYTVEKRGGTKMKKHKILDRKRLMQTTTVAMSLLIAAILVSSSAMSAATSSSPENINVEMEETILVPIEQPKGITDIDPNAQMTPSVSSDGLLQVTAAKKMSNEPLELWDDLLTIEISQSLYTAGVGADEEYIYAPEWSGSNIYYWDFEGEYQGSFTISGAANIRDLAYDESTGHMWGGSGSGTCWEMDFTEQTLESTITGSWQCRAIAYDEVEDVFYVSGWGDPVWIIDRDGSTIEQFNLALTTSTYGFAYDKWDTEYAPILWVHDQGGTGSEIRAYSIENEEFIDDELYYHDVTGEVGGAIAGGLCLSEAAGEGITGENRCVIIANAQASVDTIVCYEWAITIPPEHDISVKRIDKPETGYATADMEMKATFKNNGNHSETFDAQMTIIKCEVSDDPLLFENFSTYGTGPNGLPANWTTDWWKWSSGYQATGDSELAGEAMCYYYDQYRYPNYDYYDNYITSPKVNCSGLEKITFTFAFKADVQSNCYLYLKYRQNETSKWRDVTPWDNPVSGDFQDWFTIGCYGFQTGGDIGSEFQFNFSYIGHYSYFRYWYLDQCRIDPCGGCAEYAEIVEDVTVDVGEEKTVEFPAWTPSEWQNESTENTYEEYPIFAEALIDDDIPQNDEKIKLIELYFPWMDDVMSVTCEGPEDGPAQTFPVGGVIKNVGQNDECCFKTHVTIQEVDINNPKLVHHEDFNGYYYSPPSGWTKLGNYYAWYWSTGYTYYLPSPYSTGWKTRLYYYYSPGAELISPQWDASGVGSLEMKLGNYIGYYTAGYNFIIEVRASPSHTWAQVQPWENPVEANMLADWVYSDITIGAGSQMQMRFRGDGTYTNFRYWIFDNMDITGYEVFDAEYEESVCMDKIIPGEEVELEFDDWTPEYLEEETSGTKAYILKQWTNLEDPPDKNPANDLYQTVVELDYFHDVAVNDVLSPAMDGRGERRGYAVDCNNYPSSRMIWYDIDNPCTLNDIGAFPNSNFPQGATFIGKTMYFCDTYGAIFKKADPNLPDYESVGSSGTGELLGLAWCGKTLYGSSSSTLYELDPDDGSVIKTIGGFGTGTLMISIDCDNDGTLYGYDLGFGTAQLYEIDTSTGTATSIGPTGMQLNYGQDMSFDRNEGVMYTWAFNYGNFRAEFCSIDLETGTFTYICNPTSLQVACHAIPGKGGYPIEVYMQPGTASVDCEVINQGTFPEEDLDVYVDIYDFLTNCTNGTHRYSDNITGFDLPTPLGGTKELNFDSFNFAQEGVYGILFNLTDDDDDDLGNNVVAWGVGVDDTPPLSTHAITPPVPDGDNDYYVNNIEIAMSASDPDLTGGCAPGSGVDYIEYRINGGSWQTIPGDAGTWTFGDDGNDILIEYRAVDMVGNTEATNDFTIFMDQTAPVADEIAWEAYKNPDTKWWDVDLTASATDATADMDRVEFFINDGLHEIIEGSGPDYVFTIQWSESFRVHTFFFFHYDRAGNVVMVSFDPNNITAVPKGYTAQQHSSTPLEL
jgi:hypothetical protein